jgi:hypothetical protein
MQSSGSWSGRSLWCPQRDTSGGGTGADRPGPWHGARSLASSDAKQAQEANEGPQRHS